ncbi:glycosyltransferase [Ilyomonas limi]|uniref:Glycosyltransferase n=1 Tax=Ilyomonas limi TaxID=2575867 RepID=A0A4U3KVH3_9BACT|nr:glycosyltransferase [Ilyomonas limi]TKK65026.1 glycosyltransferase [Ilyomonas limi]
MIISKVETNTTVGPVLTNGKRTVVLHIIKSLGRGGAEMLLPETLAKHNQSQYEFHYIYFLPWKDQVVGDIERENGIVTCIPAKNNIQIFGKTGAIVQYIKTHKVQIIHCHMPWAGVIGRIAGRLAKVPVVYTEHNKWERYHKATYFFNKYSFSSQAKVLAVSGEVANSIQKHYHKNTPAIQVLRNGINIDKFSRDIQMEPLVRSLYNIPETAIVIGITCVFRKQKRLTTWLEVAKQLHNVFTDVHFIIVGDGVLKEEVYAKAKALDMHNYLHFAGLQAEVRPYLQAMDIFMMTSEFEGLPVALLEAMSMRCMPACTAAGGIGELIQDGENGVLVPIEEPEQLINKLSEYILYPEKIKAAAQHARQTVASNFSIQTMVAALENTYEEVVAG